MIPSFTLYTTATTAITACLAYIIYLAVLEPRQNPLRRLPTPPSSGFMGNHMGVVVDSSRSPSLHEALVKKHGRNMYIRGYFPWDQRLFSLDPVAIAHVLKHANIYEKPWQARAIISSLIGTGMFAAEGHMHRRQRRVATPAFSVQNLRALVLVTLQKGVELKDRWMSLISESEPPVSDKGASGGLRIDVCHWVSRATFDVIGLAGFDYRFDSIENESNELFKAYKDMFEIAINQTGAGLWGLAAACVPMLDRFVFGERYRVLERSREVIQRVAGQLIEEKKRKIEEYEKNGTVYDGKDLLSALLRSNVAVDLPPDQRISDEDILNNINSFMFAGSDSSSLSVTWILYLLSTYRDVQDRLRTELRSIFPKAPLESLAQDEAESLYAKIAELPYLENVVRETLRLIPPVHSSLRVATQDDVIPTSMPVKLRTPGGGVEEVSSIYMPKGSCVHIPIASFNLDRAIWGPDGWTFNPDRWDNLPEAVKAQPGIYNHLLTFSAGPRSCIGMKFSIIEIKMFVFILVTNFSFAESDKVGKANVVLTRPYVAGKHKEGSQCPLMVTPYVPGPVTLG